jgi:hypothetical protein
MTFSGAVGGGFAGVGNLDHGSMAFFTTNLAVGGTEKFVFVDVDRLELVILFEADKSGILMAGKTAALIKAEATSCPQRQEVSRKDQ